MEESNRRTFLKVFGVESTVGTISLSEFASSLWTSKPLQYSPQQSGNETSKEEILFQTGFEEYTTGEYPSDWMRAGNQSQAVVESTAGSGSKSFRMTGSPGGCWEAISHHPIQMLDRGTVRFTGKVGPTSEGSVGCHQNKRGKMLLRTEASQDTYPGNEVPLFTLGTDGTIQGVESTDYGLYQVDSWQDFSLEYERGNGTVTQRLRWNGDERGSATRQVADFEDELTAISLQSGDFTIYWDDISIALQPKSEDETGNTTSIPYGEIHKVLRTMSEPWTRSTTEVTYQMARKMMAQARDLLNSATNPIGLPGGELIDLVAAFNASMSLLEQGEALFHREKYRTATKAAHTDTVQILYQNLPVPYDSNKPLSNLTTSASAAVSAFLQDAITDSELKQYMRAIHDIFTLIWNHISQVHQRTTSSWKLDEKVCVSINDSKKCSDDGDAYFNSLKVVHEITGALA